MADIQLAWPEAVILLGVVAILAAAVIMATLTGENRAAAPTGAFRVPSSGRTFDTRSRCVAAPAGSNQVSRA
jgi:hypothetical protein